MASFVEQATLKLNDQTSKQADAINASLKRLFATAKSMEKALGGRGSAVAGMAASFRKATTAANTYARALDRVAGAGRTRSKSTMALPAIDSAATANLANYAKALRSVSRSLAQLNASGARLPRIPGGTGGGGRGSVPAVPGGGVVIAASSWTPMRQILANFATQIGHQVQQAIITGFSQGLKTEDVAQNRLRLQQVGPEGERASAAAISRIFAGQRQSRVGALLSQGQIAGMFAEILPTVRGDIKAAETLTKLQMQLVQLQVAAGETTQKAVEEAFQFAKAGEQSGKLSNPETGAFDEARARDFFGTLLKVAPDIGKEFTGSFVAQATKYLRASKFTQDTAGFMTALFLNEEMGSTASVGINQAIKQLSGRGVTKEILANLEKLGLISTKEINVGSVGGKTSRKRVVDEATAEEALRENIAGWISSQILPRMRKEGLDPNKPTDAARFAARVSSDRTAVDAITSLILRATELETQIKRARERDTSADTQDRLLGNSTTLAFEGLRNQWTGTLGAMAKALDTVLVPAVNLVSSALSNITSFISGSGEGGSGIKATAAGIAGLGLAAGGIAGGKALVNLFNPLNGSALALNGSAAALTRAAVALGGAGVANRVGGAAAGAAGAAGAAAGGGIAARFVKGAGWVGVAALLSELVVDYFGNGPIRQGVASTAAAITGTKLQQPGQGRNTLSDPYVQELTTQVAALTAQIEKNRAAEKLPGTAEAANAGLITQRTALQEEISRLTGLPSAFESTFATGATSLQSAATSIDTAATNFGPVAGQGILTFAGQFGAAAGAAIAAQVNNLSVNLKMPQQGPNVGTTRPQE